MASTAYLYSVYLCIQYFSPTLLPSLQVLGGVIGGFGGGMETLVEDFQSDSLELSPGEASLCK